MEQSPVRRQHTVDLCGTSQRSVRQATLDVRAITVTVKPPNARNELPPITYHVILVQESHPPESDTPVEWLLVTTLPIETSEALLRVISLRGPLDDRSLLPNLEDRLSRGTDATLNQIAATQLPSLRPHHRLASPVPDGPEPHLPPGLLHQRLRGFNRSSRSLFSPLHGSERSEARIPVKDFDLAEANCAQHVQLKHH